MGRSLLSCFFDSQGRNESRTLTTHDWGTVIHRKANTSYGPTVYKFEGSSFYRAMPCIRGTSHGPVSVCLSVSVSVCHKPVFY